MSGDWNWQEHGHCPRCGARDFGFDEPDERARIVIDLRTCRDDLDDREEWCEECRIGSPECCTDPEPVYATIVIDRRWVECPSCGEGTTFEAWFSLRWTDPDGKARHFEARSMNEAETVLDTVEKARRLTPEMRKRVDNWNVGAAEMRAMEAAERRNGA